MSSACPALASTAIASRTATMTVSSAHLESVTQWAVGFGVHNEPQPGGRAPVWASSSHQYPSASPRPAQAAPWSIT